MNNLFNTIPNFFTIFNIFKKIITVILFFCLVLIDGLICSIKFKLGMKVTRFSF